MPRRHVSSERLSALLSASCSRRSVRALERVRPGHAAGPTALGDQNLRPNIILIMTDDMAKADLSSMPSVHSLLAKKGTSFRHALTPFSLCCPDRVTMLTGQYAHDQGLWATPHQDFPLGGYAGFTSDNNTVATWLHDAGYQTAFVGKYLNGYGKEAAPARVPRDGMNGTPVEATTTS